VSTVIKQQMLPKQKAKTLFLVNIKLLYTINMYEKQLLSNSGPLLSRLILGWWRLEDIDTNHILNIIHKALDIGITTFDQADIYGDHKSQEFLGRAFAEDKSLRTRVEIVSKCGIKTLEEPGNRFKIGHYHTGFKQIVQSVERTLKALHTDYLDVLLIHRPDFLMDPEELDRAFQALQVAGKVKHFGVSNFTVNQLNMLTARMETPLVTNQIEMSPLHTEPLYDGTLDQCIEKSIHPMIWSPMAGGRLFTGTDEKALRVQKTMQEISNELGGFSVDKIALAWIMRHPANAHPIIGTMKPERIASAAAALNIELTREQWYRILVASNGEEMP
jgi:predicted oxidoreductase